MMYSFESYVRSINSRSPADPVDEYLSKIFDHSYFPKDLKHHIIEYSKYYKPYYESPDYKGPKKGFEGYFEDKNLITRLSIEQEIKIAGQNFYFGHYNDFLLKLDLDNMFIKYISNIIRSDFEKAMDIRKIIHDFLKELIMEYESAGDL